MINRKRKGYLLRSILLLLSRRGFEQDYQWKRVIALPRSMTWVYLLASLQVDICSWPHSFWYVAQVVFTTYHLGKICMCCVFKQSRKCLFICFLCFCCSIPRLDQIGAIMCYHDADILLVLPNILTLTRPTSLRSITDASVVFLDTLWGRGDILTLTRSTSWRSFTDSSVVFLDPRWLFEMSLQFYLLNVIPSMEGRVLSQLLVFSCPRILAIVGSRSRHWHGESSKLK